MAYDTDDFTLTGNFAPIYGEIDAPDLPRIQGELPRELAGVLYRNGPNPMFPPISAESHWFLGEGMVHAIRVEDGRAGYRNRWVRTPAYEAQRAERRRLAPMVFGSRLQDQSGPRANPANTNIVWHGGKLLAIDEGNLPVALDPDSLAALGPESWNGAYAGPFTAHPKIDPETGELLVFGYMAAGPGTPDISFTVIGPDGAVRRRESFQAPYPSMVHDFIVTRRHVIFPICPATIDVVRRMSGGSLIAWEPERGCHVGVMERTGGVATLKWFEAPLCYLYHPMNAFEADGDAGPRIVADVMTYPRVPLFPDLTGMPPADFGPARLVRWTIPLDGATRVIQEVPIHELRGEFPRLDERFAGLAYRHGYYAAQARPPAPGLSFDSLAHIDLADGRLDLWEAGPGRSVSEPVFVPRTADAPEGDGWLVAVMFDQARNLSDLVVLNAADVAAGPVAAVELPTRVPFGFHGNWRSAAEPLQAQ